VVRGPIWVGLGKRPSLLQRHTVVSDTPNSAMTVCLRTHALSGNLSKTVTWKGCFGFFAVDIAHFSKKFEMGKAELKTPKVSHITIYYWTTTGV
jgi:hypothetical protein